MERADVRVFGRYLMSAVDIPCVLSLYPRTKVTKEESVNNITLCLYLPDRRGSYRDLMRRPEGRT